MKFTATIPNNTWLGVAFGAGMNGVDVYWFSSDGGGTARDMYASSYSSPGVSSASHLEDVKISVVSGKY